MAQEIISANEATPETLVWLGEGLYRVDFLYKENATATVTPKQTVDKTNPDAFSPVDVDGEAVVLTASGGFMLYGPCYVGAIVASLSASGTITIMANRSVS